MAEISNDDELTIAEKLEMWRFNVALECSGASKCAVESFVLGGAVFKLSELPGHCRRGRVCVAGDGPASREALGSVIAGAVVRCRPEGRDVYGRVLARCTAARDRRRVDLACAQLSAGAAVVRYSDPRCR